MTPQEVLQHQFPGLTKRDADLALKALAAAGYAVVPTKATEAMIKAGAEKMDPTWGYPDEGVALTWAQETWDAMIAAAQQESSA